MKKKKIFKILKKKKKINIGTFFMKRSSSIYNKINKK